jgi:multidrug resistance efflux pump
MGETSTRKVIYEAMRNSRGSEPQKEGNPLRRRLVLGGAAFLLVAAGVAGYFIWHALTFVTTLRASVCARVLSLSADLDARAAQVLVHPGETVKRGQALIKLDDSEAQAALAAAESTRAISEARVQIALAAIVLRNAKLPEEVRRAEADRQESAARLAQLKKGPTQHEIDIAKLTRENAKALAKLYAGEVTEMESLVAAGYESVHNLNAAKTRLANQTNTAQQAELELARLLAGPTPEQIQAAEQVLATRDALLALARTGAQEIETLKADLAARKAELSRAEADVARCRAALDRMVITSPIGGTVVRTLVHEGEFCRRGGVAALLSDDTAGRWVEGLVHEKDARDLKVGQTARVETILGSGDYVDATVEAIGLATSSLSRSEYDSANARALGRSEMVWVKLRAKDLGNNHLPGMSACAVIRIR